MPSTRRRRLLDRLSRISSSPQLAAPLAFPLPPALTPHHASSTPTLTLAPASPAHTVEIPYGTDGEWLCIQIPLPPPPPRDHWTPLPPELKLAILRHLPPQDLIRATPTSRSFRALTTDGQLWHTLDTHAYYRRIPAPRLAALIATAGPFLRHLNLRGCLQLAADWRQDAVYHAPRNLRTCTLEGAHPSRPALQALVVGNPLLVRLDLAGCKALTGSVARLIAQSLPALEALDVSWCAALDARGLRRILEGCGALRELRASGVAGFDDAGVAAALHARTALTHLAACSTALTDEAVRVLCLGVGAGSSGVPPAPRRLKRLALAECGSLTDAALHVLAAHAPHLEGVELAGNAALGDAGVGALLAGARALTHVDVSGCSVGDAALLALARHGRAVYVNVGGCADVGDAGVVELLRRCRGVRCVQADGTRAGDAVLEEAVRSVRYGGVVGELRVEVFDCPAVTWEGVRAVLAQNGGGGGGGGRVRVKCYYGWQAVVDTHWERCGRGEWAAAERVEAAWAAHMGAEEEGGEGGGGGGRRRRRRGAGGWEEGGRGGGRCVVC